MREKKRTCLNFTDSVQRTSQKEYAGFWGQHSFIEGFPYHREGLAEINNKNAYRGIQNVGNRPR